MPVITQDAKTEHGAEMRRALPFLRGRPWARPVALGHGQFLWKTRLHGHTPLVVQRRSRGALNS